MVQSNKVDQCCRGLNVRILANRSWLNGQYTSRVRLTANDILLDNSYEYHEPLDMICKEVHRRHVQEKYKTQVYLNCK